MLRPRPVYQPIFYMAIFGGFYEVLMMPMLETTAGRVLGWLVALMSAHLAALMLVLGWRR